MKNIFLGGTCNNSKWREILIPKLTNNFFNPVVENWTPECQEEEVKQRENCDICLYVITPRMTGVYSIAEVVDDSNKRPDKTVFLIQNNDFDDSGSIIEFSMFQTKSLKQVGKMVRDNGATWCETYEELINILNS